MPNFNARNWYWKADDRLFSSSSGKLVNQDDADYLAWCESFMPTTWPRDDDGAQTDTALQDVLTPYGLTVSAQTRPPEKALGSALLVALDDMGKSAAWSTALTASKPATQAYWLSGYREYLPIDNPKLVRLAAAAKVDLQKLFKSALAG